MKPAFFCVGDYRSGEKQYRIFKASDVEDALKTAGELGYEVIAEDAVLNPNNKAFIERLVVTILEAIELRLHGVENVVACYRLDYSEAQNMKQHFMNADMNDYFPKLLDEPAIVEGLTLPNGEPVFYSRRMYPWITEYWCRVYQAMEMNRPCRMVSSDAKIMEALEIREKNTHEPS